MGHFTWDGDGVSLCAHRPWVPQTAGFMVSNLKYCGLVFNQGKLMGIMNLLWGGGSEFLGQQFIWKGPFWG